MKHNIFVFDREVCFDVCYVLMRIWLIDYLGFYVQLKNFSLIWRRHHCRWRAAKFRPMLGAQGLWAGRDLYRVTPAVTQGPRSLWTHMGMWKIYSNPDPHRGNEDMNCTLLCVLFHWGFYYWQSSWPGGIKFEFRSCRSLQTSFARTRHLEVGIMGLFYVTRKTGQLWHVKEPSLLKAITAIRA
jgi:hypothetical protein